MTPVLTLTGHVWEYQGGRITRRIEGSRHREIMSRRETPAEFLSVVEAYEKAEAAARAEEAEAAEKVPHRVRMLKAPRAPLGVRATNTNSARALVLSAVLDEGRIGEISLPDGSTYRGRRFQVPGEPFVRNSMSLAEYLCERFGVDDPMSADPVTGEQKPLVTDAWIHKVLRDAGMRVVREHDRPNRDISETHAKPRPMQGEVQ
jgi:hypothetical protein